MKQNIYDNDTFFNAYIDLRERNKGLNDVLEIPAFRAMLPDLNGMDMLDLGCGYGEAAKWYIDNGAKRVIGVDISANMIAKAKEMYSDPHITYVHKAIEDVYFEDNQFDIVVSSLALHYVADFEAVIQNVQNMLKSGGIFLFSQEHPIALAKKTANGWYEDESGRRMHWIVDNYEDEGVRKHNWFVDGVTKYHRTLATIVNTLVGNGLQIQCVSEPTATAKSEKNNERLKEERRRPPFIIIKAQNSG